MPVNLPPPIAADLHAVPGVRIGIAMAGMRKANRRDLTVFALDEGAAVAGVFTQNRFCAAPVQVCREHLAPAPASARCSINTGNANAGTGDDGLARARSHLRGAGASGSAWRREQVLPFSTGVIMETLPIDRIEAGLPAALADLRADALGATRPQAIMTTDTRAEGGVAAACAIGGKTVTVTGISKGAGMIRPNMATMLGFVATDAVIAPALLQALVREAADALVQPHHDRRRHLDQRLVRAHRHAARRPCRRSTELDSAEGAALREAVFEVATQLAQAIVRDGEGATKFITVHVDGGRDDGRVPPGGLRDRPFAAGEDGVLRQRPEPRPHPRGGRLRRHRRPRPEPDRPVPRRRARRHARRPPSGVPRGRRPARDEAKRDHGARRPAPRRGQRHACGPATCRTTTSASTPTTAPEALGDAHARRSNAARPRAPSC